MYQYRYNSYRLPIVWMCGIDVNCWCIMQVQTYLERSLLVFYIIELFYIIMESSNSLFNNYLLDIKKSLIDEFVDCLRLLHWILICSNVFLLFYNSFFVLIMFFWPEIFTCINRYAQNHILIAVIHCYHSFSNNYLYSYIKGLANNRQSPSADLSSFKIMLGTIIEKTRSKCFKSS